MSVLRLAMSVLRLALMIMDGPAWFHSPASRWLARPETPASQAAEHHFGKTWPKYIVADLDTHGNRAAGCGVAGLTASRHFEYTFKLFTPTGPRFRLGHEEADDLRPQRISTDNRRRCGG